MNEIKEKDGIGHLFGETKHDTTQFWAHMNEIAVFISSPKNPLPTQYPTHTWAYKHVDWYMTQANLNKTMNPLMPFKDNEEDLKKYTFAAKLLTYLDDKELPLNGKTKLIAGVHDDHGSGMWQDQYNGLFLTVLKHSDIHDDIPNVEAIDAKLTELSFMAGQIQAPIKRYDQIVMHAKLHAQRLIQKPQQRKDIAYLNSQQPRIAIH